MKIINIVDLFFPDAGYENNVLSKYMESFGYEYIILTTDLADPMGFFPHDHLLIRDNAFFQRTGVKVIRIHCEKMISGRALWDYNKFIKVVKSQNPDILFFCGNDTYIAIRYIINLKKSNYPILTDSHMLAMASKNRFASLFRWAYKKIVTPILVRNKIPVIRVQDDSYVEKYFGIPLSQAPWISFGTDTKLFHPDYIVKKNFRKELSIPDDAFVFIYTGKLDESKGGKLLANAFLDFLDVNKSVVLIVIGSTFGIYGEEVEDIFKSSNNRIIRFETQKYYDLAKYYQIADVSVFPKQCSLSFYDAQGCGLPVISEDNQINIDRNSHNNGYCFKSDDIEDFRKVLASIVNLDYEDYHRMSSNAYNYIIKNFNYENKAREYESIIKDVYNKGNNYI